MPQFIDTPDGEVEFPDGMSDSEIKAVLKKKYPPKVATTSDPTVSRSQAVQEAYDATPWYLKIPQAADDIVRLGADGMTFGYSDKAAAKMGELFGGQPYEQGLEAERQSTADARTRAGSAGVAADIGGALLGPGKFSAAAKLGAKIPGLLPRIIAGTGLGAAEGAGAGALSAAGHDEDVGQGSVGGALWGAPLGALSPLVSSLGRAVTGSKIPNLDQLRGTKNAAYRGANDAGIRYQPSEIDPHLQNMDDALVHANIDPELHKNAYRVLNKNIKGMSGSQSLNDLDQLRQVISRDVSGSPGENAMRDIMRKHVDDIIDSNPDPRIKQAREANRVYKNRQMMERSIEKADDTANGNPQARVAGSVLGDKNLPFVKPNERAAVRQFTRGGALGTIGGALDRYGWMAGAPGAAAGALIGGPLMGAAPGAVAAISGAKALGKGMAALDRARNLKDARRVVSGGQSRRYGTGIEDVMRQLGILGGISGFESYPSM